ncbi:hypothetical protein HDU86_007884 [Geranomyces michiganensis]|nr:hypothetical protein HDU86_007884 [Geranomyces michiganensis]
MASAAALSPKHQALSNRDDSLSYDVESRGEHLRTLSQGLFDDLSRDLDAIGHASADVGRVRAQLGRLEDYLDDTNPNFDDQNISTDDDDSPLINPVNRARNHSGVDAPSHVLRAGIMAADQSDVAAANGGLTNFSLSFDIYEDEAPEGLETAAPIQSEYRAADTSNRGRSSNSPFRYIPGIEDFESRAGLDDPSLTDHFNFGSANLGREPDESSRFGASVFAGLDSLINREEQRDNGARANRSGLHDLDISNFDGADDTSASYGYPTTRTGQESAHDTSTGIGLEESFQLGGESVGSSPVLPTEPGYKSIMDESDVDDHLLPEIAEGAPIPQEPARRSSRRSVLSSPRHEDKVSSGNGHLKDAEYDPGSSIVWQDRESIKIADDDREARYRRSFQQSLDNVSYDAEVGAHTSRSALSLSGLGQSRAQDAAFLAQGSAPTSPVRTKERPTAPLQVFRQTPRSRSRSPDRSLRYQQPISTSAAMDSATWRPPSHSSIDFGDLAAHESRSNIQPDSHTVAPSQPDPATQSATANRGRSTEMDDVTPPSALSVDLREPEGAVKTVPDSNDDRNRKSRLPVPSNTLSAGLARTSSNADLKEPQAGTSSAQGSTQKETVSALRVMQDRVGRLESEKAIAKNRIRGLELELAHTRGVALYEQNDVRVTGPRGRSLGRRSSRERSRSRSRGGAEIGGRRSQSRGRATRSARDVIAEEEAIQLEVDKALREKVERGKRVSVSTALAAPESAAVPTVPTTPPARPTAAPVVTASTATQPAEPTRSQEDAATAAAIESWRSRSQALEQQLSQTRTEKDRILLRLEETRAQVDILRQQVVMSEIEAERRRQRQVSSDQTKHEAGITEAALRASYSHVPEVAAPEMPTHASFSIPPARRDGSFLGREDVQALREEIEGQRSVRKKVASGGGRPKGDSAMKKTALHNQETKKDGVTGRSEATKKDRLRKLVVTRILEERGKEKAKVDQGGGFTVTKEGQRPEWKRVQPPLPTKDKAAQRATPASADAGTRKPSQTNATTPGTGVSVDKQLGSSHSKRNAKTQTAGGKIIITGDSGRPSEAALKRSGSLRDPYQQTRRAVVETHDRSHPRPPVAVTRELPFTVGRSTQKSHSVTANLQQVFSLLKSHDPRRCSVCVPREEVLDNNSLQPRTRRSTGRRDVPHADQRRRRPSRKAGESHDIDDDDADDCASFHGAPLDAAAAYAAAHFGLNRRAAGDRDVGHKVPSRDPNARPDRGVETLAAVLKLLEGEYDDLKRKYNKLVEQYGAASGIARKPPVRAVSADIRALGDDLRMVIRSMDAKGDQIAILRDILKGFGAMVGRSRPGGGSGRVYGVS